MPSIWRECLGEVHGNRAVDNVALARKVFGEPSSHRRRNADKLRIDKRSRRDAIGNVRKERPRACPDQRNCE